MVYSTPANDSATAFRPQHRRTRSSGATFSNERTDGAFVSLGALPRRKAVPAKKFHFRSADDDDDDAFPPPLDAVTRKASPTLNSLGLYTETLRSSPQPHFNVPFPRQSPSGPPSPHPFSPRPSLMQRTPSSPLIRLSNGKPLKSSLKSSHSSPNIPALHIRTQSAPATPSAKSVHFGDEDEDEDERPIEQIRLFKSSGKPANLLSFKPGEDTETETEAESAAYPFPTMPSAPSPPSSHWELDFSSAPAFAIPKSAPSPYANIHLEAVALPKTRPYTLRGSVLVRNLSFEKTVAVRFTLDDWQTTSEVLCKHVVSLPSLPPPFPGTRTVGDAVGIVASHSPRSRVSDDGGEPLWDRFSFVVRLEDYEHRLNERTLFMVARYTAPGVGEWWDNNDGRNYKVGFKKTTTPAPAPTHAEPSSPVLSASQQGSFRAPSTLRSTPVTRGDVKPAANSGLPAVMPLPQRQGPAMKLKLANYAAPGSVPSVGMAPPVAAGRVCSDSGSGRLSPIEFGSPKEEREREERIEDVEREWREGFYWDGRYMREEEEGEGEKRVEVKMVGEIVGGQFVSSVVERKEGKEDIPTPSMSSAESSPPDSGVTTPVNGGMAPAVSGGARESTYAAFVRKWCFAQTGTRWLDGLEMGVGGGGEVGFGMGMGRRMGEGGMGVGTSA
ncbi:carbohydrate-binding module family 21 protein [Neolentinus lepideus HHB14362 ss-1]|uniref:Carbohydrate-binding module family 21 protein n=1 Tax=Neolentinus lepideus HHB14362 ss-1 TaxID=1314782 RepID=A0A165U277_9AGAM|nr:carbohydrate-binding module family 21 protein [Neolentinus lepideus HHB14362 ss-1]